MIGRYARKPFLLILPAIVILFIAFVEVPYRPPGNTRVILDHSLQTIIAPPCFEQAELSNNLSESTLANARNKGYGFESACSERSLAQADMTLLQIMMEITGAKTSRWGW